MKKNEKEMRQIQKRFVSIDEIICESFSTYEKIHPPLFATHLSLKWIEVTISLYLYGGVTRKREITEIGDIQ